MNGVPTAAERSGTGGLSLQAGQVQHLLRENDKTETEIKVEEWEKLGAANVTRISQ